MNLPISVHYKMDDVGSEPIAPQVSTSNKCNLGGVTLYFYANHFIVRNRSIRLIPTLGSLG